MGNMRNQWSTQIEFDPGEAAVHGGTGNYLHRVLVIVGGAPVPKAKRGSNIGRGRSGRPDRRSALNDS
jgi:hypothetical protein